MKRTKYYVIHCTPEERDAGKDHYEPFSSLSLAVKRAGEISNDEFISVERHHEVFERNEWLPDWDMSNWNQTIQTW